MEINRKIALIILVGLLAGLFGSFSFLMGMETAVIKDVNGVECKLNQDQRYALARCETLKPFLVESERPERLEKDSIDFSDVQRPFITESNLQQLAAIISDSQLIKKITDNKTALELFQLADYLMAPKKIVRALGQDARIVISERVVQLNELGPLNEEQSAELHNLKVAECARENGKFDIHGLVRKLNKKNLNLSVILNYDSMRDQTYINLSDEKIGKIVSSKLQSLNGIQKLVFRNEQGRTQDGKVRSITLDNQDIEKVDLGALKRTFPQLNQIYLKNNLIEKISETEKIRNLKINLNGNPLKSITIERPERCNYLSFKTDNPEVKVDLVQNRFSKTHTWLKSVLAKSKLFQDTYIGRFGSLGLFVGSGFIGGCVGIIEASIKNVQELERVQEGIKQIAVVSSQSRIPIEECTGKTLQELIEAYGNAAYVGTLVSPAERDLVKDRVNEEGVEYLLKGMKIGCYAYGAYLVANFLFDTLWNENLNYNSNWRVKVAQNSARIRIKTGDRVVEDFPSNYTYNLLGKF
ncbi:MAG: hypothetical protein AMXMBFR12_04740 [Candidatus Babeliales bacterium]